MGWFVRLVRRDGESIYVRPEQVKAVYSTVHAGWSGSNIVIDGHDFDIEGDPLEIMRAVEFDLCHHAETPTV